MPRPRRRQLLLAALATLTSADRLQDEGVEVRVAAKQTRCIYEELPEGVGGTLEVFVLAGGGEMDIDVAVDGPMKVDESSGLPAKNGRPAARVTRYKRIQAAGREYARLDAVSDQALDRHSIGHASLHGHCAEGNAERLDAAARECEAHFARALRQEPSRQ